MYIIITKMNTFHMITLITMVTILLCAIAVTKNDLPSPIVLIQEQLFSIKKKALSEIY